MKKLTFALKWREILKSYSEVIRREVYEAVIEYAATGEIIDMQPVSRMAFDFIRYELDEKTRRREERLAKKEEAKNLPESRNEPQPDTNPNINEPDLYKITNDYYRTYSPPKPFFINQGALKVSITADKIRYFVILCAKDLIEAGKTPENTPGFLSEMDYIVSNRIKYIQYLLAQQSPNQSLSRRGLNRIIMAARERFNP